MSNPKKNKSGQYALSILDKDKADRLADTHVKKILDKAAAAASATDNFMHQLLRFDIKIVNGISSILKEYKISDMILGLNVSKGISSSFLGNLTEGILTKCNSTTLIIKPKRPICMIKRQIIVVPKNAERKIEFPFWLVKVWNIGRNSGAKLLFKPTKETIKLIREIHTKYPIECEFEDLKDWDDFLLLAGEIGKDDYMIIIMSRKDKISYQRNMGKIPHYLNNFSTNTSYILIYPMQTGVEEVSKIDLKNPTFIEPLEKLDEIGKSIARLFSNK